jgi:alpha-tubulin suppressor-like RCC1 family protein
MSAGKIMAGRAVLQRGVIPAVLILLTAGLCLAVPASQDALAASQGTSSIAAGVSQTCAIEGGKAYCWGADPVGALGDGTTNNSSVPVAVDTSGVLAGKILTQISTSNETTCALDSTGAAYCWGSNGDGELGDGSAGGFGDYSDVPVAVDASGVLAGKILAEISVGDFDVCALDSTGAAYCWGSNADGELGNATTTDSSVPVAVDTSGALAGKTLTQIAAGGGYACALDSTGAAYCWGVNGNGEQGNGTTNGSSVPVAVDTSGALAGKTLTQIAAGGGFACALDSTGATYCWGGNFDGNLGNGTTTNSSVPVAVDTSGVLAGKTLTQISGGFEHACALDTAGTVYCWGNNDFGELGDDTTTTQSTVPVLVSPQAPTSITATAGGTTATVAWTAPAYLNGGTLTGYTATAAPGGAACTTTGAATCIITGLANGSTYSITVVAHTTVGDSGASTVITVTEPGIAIDQTITQDGTSTVTTAPFTTGGPRLLVAFTGSDGPATKQTTTVSGAGLTWTLAERANTKGGTAEIWTAQATAPLNNATVTSTPKTPGYNQSLTVVAFTGASGTGATASAGKAKGAPTVSLTTTQPESWAFAVGEDYSNAIARTLGPGQSQISQWVDLTPGETFWVQDQTATTPTAGTTVTLNDTAPTTDIWDMAAVEILPVGS